jgi:hypothetical protein
MYSYYYAYVIMPFYFIQLSLYLLFVRREERGVLIEITTLKTCPSFSACAISKSPFLISINQSINDSNDKHANL